MLIDEEYNRLIGETIRQRREELHLSQSELARRLGYVHKSSVSSLEIGTRAVPINKINTLAIILEITPEELLHWSDLFPNNPDRKNSHASKPIHFAQPLSQVEQNLIDLFRNATDYGKGKAVADLENNQLPANKKTAE